LVFLAALAVFWGGGWRGCAGAMGQWNTPNPVVSFEKTADGLEVRQKDGVLRLEVKAEDVMHVTYAPLGLKLRRSGLRMGGGEEGLAGGGVRGELG
jgi:hypothetical protein